jgi:hypothetical protein
MLSLYKEIFLNNKEEKLFYYVYKKLKKLKNFMSL